MIFYVHLHSCVLQVVLSNFLRHIWQLKHFLCHLAPAPIISSAWYTLSAHRGHLPGPSASVDFGGILQRRQPNKTLKEFDTSLAGSQLRVNRNLGSRLVHPTIQSNLKNICAVFHRVACCNCVTSIN